jgi:hypothetical protein
MKPTLFDIAREYRSDVEKLGDLDLPDDVISDTLEGMSGELTVKARNVAAFAADLDTTAAAMKEAEKRMKARREAVERRAERLRHYLLSGMQYAGIERIDGPDFCLRIKQNPPAVEVFEPGLVPADYMKQPDPPPATVDKALVKQAIKDGFEVPGCRLVHGQRLEIA